ncbi:hypothetical protein Kisp02_56110 [Kineosporia sp. NBRC 101731]|nr:hypothetical protein Kisp02_56110 [Kineosporia sp. NBRC 101731]
MNLDTDQLVGEARERLNELLLDPVRLRLDVLVGLNLNLHGLTSIAIVLLHGSVPQVDQGRDGRAHPWRVVTRAPFRLAVITFGGVERLVVRPAGGPGDLAAVTGLRELLSQPGFRCHAVAATWLAVLTDRVTGLDQLGDVRYRADAPGPGRGLGYLR